MFAPYLTLLLPTPFHTNARTEFYYSLPKMLSTTSEDLNPEASAPEMPWFSGRFDKFPIAEDWDL